MTTRTAHVWCGVSPAEVKTELERPRVQAGGQASTVDRGRARGIGIGVDAITGSPRRGARLWVEGTTVHVSERMGSLPLMFDAHREDHLSWQASEIFGTECRERLGMGARRERNVFEIGHILEPDACVSL